MIAYNKEWLNNLRLYRFFEQGDKDGKITSEEFDNLRKKFPVGFYTPAIGARVGLFIITFIIILFSGGLLSLMFAETGFVTGGGWLIFLGLGSVLALELLLVNQNYFRAGVDDALIFFSALQINIGFAIIFHQPGGDYLALSVAVFITCLLFAVRYVDMVMAATCCLAFFCCILFLFSRLGSIGLSTVPFILIALALGVNMLLNRFKTESYLIHYQNSLLAAQAVILLILYAAGNFYVVQNLCAAMNGPTPKGIAASFFWMWTFAVPIVYLVMGIRKKDSLLIRIALILVTAAVLTFRSYYHVMSAGAALTIAGGGILAIIYWLTQYLKTPKHGFTLAETDRENLDRNLIIESLVIAQTAGKQHVKPEGVNFGGGDFGGGGSSAGF